MNRIEMINEMLKMQEALDEAIYKGHKCEFNIERTYLALIDEVGELTHELKANWCWWKKKVNPVDNDKVLEELIDVWHFVLSIINNTGVKIKWDGKELTCFSKLFNIISMLINYDELEDIDYYIVSLTYKLGFTIEDVYEAYIRKNKINYERLNSGY